MQVTKFRRKLLAFLALVFPKIILLKFKNIVKITVSTYNNKSSSER